MNMAQNVINALALMLVLALAWWAIRFVLYVARYGIGDSEIERMLDIIEAQKGWREIPSIGEAAYKQSITWISESDPDIRIHWETDSCFDDGIRYEALTIAPGRSVCSARFVFENDQLVRYEPECGHEVEDESITEHHKRSAYQLLEAVHNLLPA